jgi:hypothetical protein
MFMIWNALPSPVTLRSETSAAVTGSPRRRAREGPEPRDPRRGGVERKAGHRQLVVPAQVLDDRDPGAEQAGVDRAYAIGHVVDVDRIDPDRAAPWSTSHRVASRVRNGASTP